MRIRALTAFPVLLLLLAPALGADLLVPSEYDTIQAAIDAAEDGDVIHLDPDLYFENIDLLGKTIEILGSDDPIDTVIDGSFATAGSASGSVIRFSGGEGPGTRIYGVTLRAGSGSEFITGSGETLLGGGGVWIQDATATIENCVIEDNDEAGIQGRDSDLTIESCIVRGNMDRGGIGLFGDSSLTLCNSEIRDNDAALLGSGVHTQSGVSLTIDGCRFEGNSGGITTGGAISFWGAAVITNSEFVDNSGVFIGGGVSAYIGPAEFSDCTFEENVAGHGGAVYLGTEEGIDNTFERCIFVGNSAATGAAVRPDGPGGVILRRCTFVDNSDTSEGAAVYIANDPTPQAAIVELDSCVVWGQGSNALEPGTEGTISVEYSLIEGGHAGVGNLDEDPLFVDAAAGDYSLASDSPCIDAGNPANSVDPDGTTADIGAIYYRQSAIFRRGDADGDTRTSGLIDALFLLEWAFVDGEPPTCLDAADVDDSGDVSALSDGLWLLLWGFTDAPPPPAPGPSECGFDPDFDADGIGCEIEPDCS